VLQDAVAALASDPAQPGVLCAGLSDDGYDVDNGRGVYVSRDFGLTWQPFGSGGPNGHRVVTLLAAPIYPARLEVGTGGHGLFRCGGQAS